MTYTWPERIAWCEPYMSRKAIANHCGIAYTTLADIIHSRTGEPRGYAAVRLYQLSEIHNPATRPITAESSA